MSTCAIARGDPPPGGAVGRGREVTHAETELGGDAGERGDDEGDVLVELDLEPAAPRNTSSRLTGARKRLVLDFFLTDDGSSRYDAARPDEGDGVGTKPESSSHA